jgi:hypothetical protein
VPRRSGFSGATVIHTILKPLRYVFFRVLTSKLRDPYDPTPVLTASLVTILLLFGNAVGLTMIVNATMHRTLLPPFPGGHVALGGTILVTAVLGHRAMSAAWVEGTGLANLAREFAPDPALERRRTVLFWSYVILSFGFPTALAVCAGILR